MSISTAPRYLRCQQRGFLFKHLCHELTIDVNSGEDDTMDGCYSRKQKRSRKTSASQPLSLSPKDTGCY